MALTLLKVTTPNQGQTGTKMYNFVANTTAPNLYKPSIGMKIQPNKPGTNHMVTYAGRYPLVSEKDGVWTQNNLIKLDVAFSALQNVNSETEALALIDGIVEVLKHDRLTIAEGLYI